MAKTKYNFRKLTPYELHEMWTMYDTHIDWFEYLAAYKRAGMIVEENETNGQDSIHNSDQSDD